ncbi:MAG: hypothetical protein LW817_01385 [Candidatus Caenarcaniphilales bacterium]|jgi:hypothetical protein|nr:hypothetical protein [Candidatus Caenarcaniphilales bacterium]
MVNSAKTNLDASKARSINFWGTPQQPVPGVDFNTLISQAKKYKIIAPSLEKNNTLQFRLRIQIENQSMIFDCFSIVSKPQPAFLGLTINDFQNLRLQKLDSAGKLADGPSQNLVLDQKTNAKLCKIFKRVLWKLHNDGGSRTNQLLPNPSGPDGRRQEMRELSLAI